MTVALRRNNAAEVASPPVDVSVDDSALHDDLVERLEALAPHPRATRISHALVGLLVLLAGFIGGVLVQRNVGTASPNASACPIARASRAGAERPVQPWLGSPSKASSRLICE